MSERLLGALWPQERKFSSRPIADIDFICKHVPMKAWQSWFLFSLFCGTVSYFLAENWVPRGVTFFFLVLVPALWVRLKTRKAE